MGNPNLTCLTCLYKQVRFRSTHLFVKRFGFSFVNPFNKQVRFKFGVFNPFNIDTNTNPIRHDPSPNSTSNKISSQTPRNIPRGHKSYHLLIKGRTRSVVIRTINPKRPQMKLSCNNLNLQYTEEDPIPKSKSSKV